MAFCLISALRYDAIGDILSMGLELARALKARRYEALLLAYSAELALVERRRGGGLVTRETGIGSL